MIIPLVLAAWATLASAKYYDLTYPMNANSVYWIKDKYELTPLVRQKDPHWIATNKIITAEHGGTHMDAPFHFNPDGWKLTEIPLNRLFMVEGVLINKTAEVEENPEYEVTVEDIKEWEKENGPLPDKCVVIVYFGWGSRYPDRTAYLGLKGEGDWNRHFPVITPEAADYLVASSKVYGVGTDTISPDNEVPQVHITLTKNNIFIIENLDLNNIEGVRPRDFKLVILPLKSEDGTAAPTYVVLTQKDEVV